MLRLWLAFTKRQRFHRVPAKIMFLNRWQLPAINSHFSCFTFSEQNSPCPRLERARCCQLTGYQICSAVSQMVLAPLRQYSIKWGRLSPNGHANMFAWLVARGNKLLPQTAFQEPYLSRNPMKTPALGECEPQAKYEPSTVAFEWSGSAFRMG